MKCLLTNDIHLGINRNDTIWLEQSIKLFNHIIDECHKRDIYTLCILGDFFHDRKSIGIKTLDTALKIADLLRDNNINVIYLIGNHDVFYKTDINVSPLRIFNEYKNIQIIKEPTVIDDVGFVSWTNDIDLDVKYLFGHLEINDFPVTNNRVFEKSHHNPSDFSRYDHVITGHFHIPSTRLNITYLGAPYHMNFNDVGGIRGFYEFDNGNLNFIEFPCIKFVYVSSETTPDKNVIEGNIIKLIFEKDYGTVENNNKIENIQQFNPLRLDTDFSKLTNEISVDDTEAKNQTMKTNKEILFDFIDIAEHPSHINPQKIKSIIDMLLTEQ